MEKSTVFICENCGKEHNGSYGSGRFCSSKCARSFSTKMNRDKINKKVSNTFKNKIRNGDVDFLHYKTYNCKYCNKEYTILTTQCSRLYCSKECKERWLNEKSKRGGYREGSVKSHHGHYKGFILDSTWELAFLIYHLDNGSNIKRCTKKFEYEYNGKKRFYNPDFEIDGVIYYLDER